MEIFIKAAQLILSLSILVLVHEWGHYIAAKIFKTRVEKFYLFFDPWFALFKFKKGETEYGIGWLPLGGYVKIAGMIDESMDKEQMKEPPQPWEFRSKPAWQRLIIMLGGITMNVILAIFIYSMISFARGDQYIPNANLTYGIAADSTAMKIGLQSGDKIISVDGKPIEKYTEVVSDIIVNGAKTIEVNRNGETKTINTGGDDGIKTILDAPSPDFITPRVPGIIDTVLEKAPADSAGLKKGDRVVSVDSTPAAFFDQIKPYLLNHAGKNIAISITRNNKPLKLNVKVTKDGTIGIDFIDPFKVYKSDTTRYGFLASFPAGVDKAKTALSNYVKPLSLIFSPKVKGYKHLTGFIGMANMMSPTWDWGWFWSFTAFLSMALAFMNLLPIPALDGGHVMFTLYEMATHRKPNEKFLEYAQIVGMVILLSLMLFANGNDVFKHFIK